MSSFTGGTGTGAFVVKGAGTGVSVDMGAGMRADAGAGVCEGTGVERSSITGGSSIVRDSTIIGFPEGAIGSIEMDESCDIRILPSGGSGASSARILLRDELSA